MNKSAAGPDAETSLQHAPHDMYNIFWSALLHLCGHNHKLAFAQHDAQHQAGAVTVQEFRH